MLFPKLFSLDNSPVQNALGLISFTCDIWSNQIRQPFLAITAHWMANVDETSSLRLKTALIAFHPLTGHHTGEMLAKAVIGLFDRADITAKVSTTAFVLLSAVTSFHKGRTLHVGWREQQQQYAGPSRDPTQGSWYSDSF